MVLAFGFRLPGCEPGFRLQGCEPSWHALIASCTLLFGALTPLVEETFAHALGGPVGL
jgi:hypothetical protein